MTRLVARLKMATTKFDIEKFDQKFNFSLWHMKMKVILTQNTLQKAIESKDKLSYSLSASKKEEMDARALATIDLCLSNDVLREVIKE